MNSSIDVSEGNINERRVIERVELFVSMEKLKKITYPIYKKFGGISGMDLDDFYSIANETLWTSAKSFDDNKNDCFEAFFKYCLSNKIKQEMTKKNTKKRIPQKNPERLDRPVSSEYGITFGESIESKFNLDDYIPELRDDENVENYLNSLSKKQKRIADLVIEGYSLQDIRKILKMSPERFSACVNKMKTFDKRLILKGKRN